MKRDEIKQLHESNVAELQAKLQELQQEFAKLKLELKAGKLADTASVSRTRKNMARVKTVLKQKQLLEKAEKATKETK